MTECQRLVLKRAVLLPPLLFALWLLKDEESGQLSVWQALRDHPPSMRVYRALSEIALLMACTAVALSVWSRTAGIGTSVVGRLLFAPPTQFSQQEDHDYQNSIYRPVSASDDDIVEEGQDSDEEDETFSENDTVGPQPPLAAAVAGATLDLLLCELLSLFFFTLSCAGGRVDGMPASAFQRISQVAAPVFPLGLFVGFTVACFMPWKRRKDFWIVLSATVSAPFCDVEFRDGFVGDILTSSVRPMQDLAFTVFYVFAGLRGWWSQTYDLNHADTPVERSWLLHTVVLPACMVSPLWWRFLQNLRQSFDEKKRWPYLGNALKYMVAAEVAMFGVFDPNKKQHFVWITSFVVATLYQVWWDVFMDWELLQVSRAKGIKLRATRLYPYKPMYWIILVVNFVLRFCWTLSFLPQVYLHPSGIIKETFEGDFTAFIGPVLACAEIVRRTLWGFLRLELETIKVGKVEKTSVTAGIELKRMSIQDSSEDESRQGKLSVLDPSLPMEMREDLPDTSDLQLLGELCLWATFFFAMGILAAANRETM